MKNTQTVTVLVLVAAGSQYEQKELNGISHFLEHMFFKGTKKRPRPLDVAESLDKVGGSYNAFTGDEFTGYWAKTDARHQALALDWVSDIFLNSRMPTEEIERERGVIIEEMHMYLDTPMIYIEDVWKELLYNDQPAGRPTIGHKENILNFKRKDLLNYLRDYYTAAKTVVVLAGNIDEKESLKKAKDCFQGVRTKTPINKKKIFEKQAKPQSLIRYKQTDQTHLALGVRGYNLFQKEKYAQTLLAVILGGNMSSRLFNKIRGERGLAYYIHTNAESFSDAGYLTSQAGVPHKNVAEVVSLILEEYSKIKEQGVSEEELQKAKDYLKGTTVLNMESSSAQASFYGSQAVLLEQMLSLKEKFAKIDKIKKKDIAAAAATIFKPEKLNLALIGPHNSRSKINNLLKI